MTGGYLDAKKSRMELHSTVCQLMEQKAIIEVFIIILVKILILNLKICIFISFTLILFI